VSETVIGPLLYTENEWRSLDGLFLPPNRPENASLIEEGAGVAVGDGAVVGVYVGATVGVYVGAVVGVAVGVESGAGVEVGDGVLVAEGVAVAMGEGLAVGLGVGDEEPPAASTAARAFTRPAPNSSSSPAGPRSSADWRRMASAAAGDSPGFAPKIRATTPAATGEANEVPLEIP
jgi:hypothetical protein